MTLEQTYLKAVDLKGKISQDTFRDLMDTEIVAVVHAHAEHVETDGSEELHSHWYRCSECKHPLDKWDNYCKHCGAIMDEEVDHGTD